MTSVRAVSQRHRGPSYKAVTWGNLVSEGGLELPASGGQQGAPATTETVPEQASGVARHLPSFIRDHSDSRAPVSREVSLAAIPLRKAGCRVL